MGKRCAVLIGDDTAQGMADEHVRLLRQHLVYPAEDGLGEVAVALEAPHLHQVAERTAACWRG